MRILIVEDQLLFGEMLDRFLDAQPDMTVVGMARSVQEALVKTRQLKPDIILMDFLLSDGTGLEVARVIRAESLGTKIIFLTIYEGGGKVFDAIRHGAYGYLPKSVTLSHLLGYLRGIEHPEVGIQPERTSRNREGFAPLPPRKYLSAEAISQLTAREREVLMELKTGATNRQIAARLLISEETVKNHVGRILSKLNLNSRYDIG